MNSYYLDTGAVDKEYCLNVERLLRKSIRQKDVHGAEMLRSLGQL